MFLFFFFFTIPRPPTSTLFPYTTLFRSDLSYANLREAVLSGADLSDANLRAADLSGAWLGNYDLLVGEGDRKSTRLNSSHSQISYAVFCLKKKKYVMSWTNT